MQLFTCTCSDEFVSHPLLCNSTRYRILFHNVSHKSVIWQAQDSWHILLNQQVSCLSHFIFTYGCNADSDYHCRHGNTKKFPELRSVALSKCALALQHIILIKINIQFFVFILYVHTTLPYFVDKFVKLDGAEITISLNRLSSCWQRSI